MKRLIPLLSILILSNNSKSMIYEKEFLISPSAKEITWSNSELQLFYKEHNLSILNNYITKDSFFFNLARTVKKLNEVYIYDSLSRKLIFYNGIHCTNNRMLLESMDFQKLSFEETSDHFESIFRNIIPISPLNYERKKYTAILIWNLRLGIKSDDNIFDWERILIEKYHDDIRIIKVNYDNNDCYNEPYKFQISTMFNEMYNSYGKNSEK